MADRVICLVVLVVISSLVAAEESIRKAMEEHQVVPDVIDKAPEKLIEVHMNNILIFYHMHNMY